MKFTVKISEKDWIIRLMNSYVGCQLFPESTQEEQEILRYFSKSIFGTVVFGKKKYVFYYSATGNDGLIVSSYGVRTEDHSIKLLIKAACMNYISSIRND